MLALPGNGDPAGVDLEVVSLGGVAVVCVRGEVDLASAPALECTLQGLEDRPVVLDLAGVSYFDAAGIAVAVNHDRVLQTHGARLVLRNASAFVRRLLEITGDDHLVER